MRTRSAPADDDSSTLFVGNVCPTTTPLELRAALSAVCPTAVQSVRTVSRGDPPRRREFAFATFQTAVECAAAKDALLATAVVLHERTLLFRDTKRQASYNAAASLSSTVLSKREPCSKCGTSIRLTRLRQHALVCPARHRGTQRWYKRGINQGGDGGSSSDDDDLRAAAAVPLAELAALQAALRSAVAVVCSGESDAAVPLEVKLLPSLAEYVASAPKSKRNPESVKHRAQQSGIAGHLADIGAFGERGLAAIVEFGAGSGFLASAVQLGFRTQTERAGSHFYLIDRQTPPMRRGDKRMAKGSCTRIKCDLADLHLRGLVEGQGAASRAAEAGGDEVAAGCGAVAGIGKHLCGVATDLSLRCFAELSDPAAADSLSPPSSSSSRVPRAPRLQPRYLALAPCCYHRCRWSSLVGREALAAAGVTSAMFRLAARLSPMGHNVAAKVDAEEADGEREEAGDDEASVKREIARLFVRLVNGARSQYLAERGWTSRVVRYVPRDVTPQNILLLATRAVHAV